MRAGYLGEKGQGHYKAKGQCNERDKTDRQVSNDSENKLIASTGRR